MVFLFFFPHPFTLCSGTTGTAPILVLTMGVLPSPLAFDPHMGKDLEAYALHDSDTDGDVEESDVDAIPSDVDDRCESDISGVAVDYDDDDWVVAGDDGEIPLSEGNVHRSYRHHANSSLNSILTTLAIMALFLALGTGFGHFLGELIHLLSPVNSLFRVLSLGAGIQQNWCLY